MILKEIYLYPDLEEYDEISSSFRKESRSICNYLERRLKAIKYKVDGFKRICFIGRGNPRPKSYINTSKVLVVELPFVVDEYRVSKDKNLYFGNLLYKGIEKIKEQNDIPYNEFLKWIEEFKEGGFLNRWTFKSRVVREYNLRYSLECELTLDEFILTLVVERNKKTIVNEKIATTIPDELIFMPMLKDIKCVDETIIVLDKRGNIIYKKDIIPLITRE